MTNLERKARVMDILDTWLLRTPKLKYSCVIVMSEDAVNNRDKDIIGIHFEMSMLDADDYWDGNMTELEEVISECGYGIDWYSSVEMHIYPKHGFAPTNNDWEQYYEAVRYNHL